MMEDKLLLARKLKSRWKRRWRLSDWKIEIELEKGPNKDVTMNAYCLIDRSARRAVVQVDPRYPIGQMDYIIAHEIGHIVVDPIGQFVLSVIPRELGEDKVFTDGINLAEDEVIDHMLRAGWKIERQLDPRRKVEAESSE